MQVPSKPFDDYKWIWASYAPTESLNDPAVFLGVLRAMRECEGKMKSSSEFQLALQRVEDGMTGRFASPVRLARTDPRRNLLRNSGQYWQATGVLTRKQGIIELSTFGRKIADGEIARGELGPRIVESLRLPNRLITRDWSAWDEAGLVIEPLKLILSILTELRRSGYRESTLSVSELTRIVIPLAGTRASVDNHCEAIREYRAQRLDISQWPNCVPRANDRRMAREFLLFLRHHGFVEAVKEGYLGDDTFALIGHGYIGAQFEEPPVEGSGFLGDLLEGTPEGLFIARETQVVKRLSRPGQPRFRRNVFERHGAQCLLTGERMAEVLDAAHIVPVEYRGSDDVSNGLCLRSDVHTLFDSGHIRIRDSGEVRLSEKVKGSMSYSALPGEVDIPTFVGRQALQWRWDFI